MRIHSLTITLDLLVIAILLACGLIGGLFPAMRAARVSVGDALRMG